MILIDLNQVLISNLMMTVNSDPSIKLNENLIRHTVLNSLRSYIQQFRSKYGNVVICCDSKKYWRRDIFPFYKCNRKKDRDKSEFDWGLIFETLNKIRDELKENFPYRVIEVEGAEADDVIAVLAKKFCETEDILILSSDKDFVQLQRNKNILQYSPILKRFISTEDPKTFIREHILKGDRGDGIPNFLSADNVFVTGERQKAINKKKMTEWLTKEPSEFCVTDTMMRGYSRNQMLVDLDYIPKNISNNILETYESTKPSTKAKMVDYFMEKRLVSLMEVANEF